MQYLAKYMIDKLFFFLEVIFELFVLVLIVIALIYYSSAFIEERMKTMTKIIKILNIFILGISSLLFFSSFSKYLSFFIIISNILWLCILFTGFPFVNLTRPDFLLAIITTVISHALMMIHFLQHDEVSSLTTASYFVLYVWIIPILIIISLDAITCDDFDDKDTNEKEAQLDQKPHSYIRIFFSNLLNKATEYLPHNTDKHD